MSDFVTWLLAQLDADEAAARAALAPSEMHPYGDESLTPYTSEQVPDAVRGYLGGPWGDHFARHDPARVLAEVAAKRAIVEAVASGFYDSDLGVALRALASVYEGAPGWQEEWR